MPLCIYAYLYLACEIGGRDEIAATVHAPQSPNTSSVTYNKVIGTHLHYAGM